MYMIDKDAVLNMIDINIEPHTHGAWDSGYNVALSEMREKIKQMPTVEAEPDNGWISVDDRLPEIKEHYRSELVICYSPDGEHEYLFDYYEMNGLGQGCFTAEKYFGITITHWQPLPKPPKGE